MQLDSDSPGKRLASFRKSQSMSQRSFASSLGVSGGFVGQIEADLQQPSRSFLQKISERYRVSADWLLYGTGEMLAEQLPGFKGRHSVIGPPDLGQPSFGDFRFGEEEFSMIRRMDLSVSAGIGLIPVDGGEREALAFSQSWLSKNGINADLAVLVRVEGDSMAPGIPPNALVLVHLPEMTVEKEGIYAFSRGESCYVKRLVPTWQDDRSTPSALAILSDNSSFSPQVVTGKEMNEIRIIGRVRCVLITL